MKEKNFKRPNKAAQNEEDFWVDVHDDDLMVELGIRPPKLAPKDPSVWTKTSNEKRLLKAVRTRRDVRISIGSPKTIPIRSKLIIFLKKNKKYPHTTYSTECWQHEVGYILNRYWVIDRKTNFVEPLVAKYIYNGKTYQPNERPFWYR